jgi:hypothetical protein
MDAMSASEGRRTWLVYGWKIGPEAVKKFMEDMSPEAQEAGLRLIISDDQEGNGYVGEVLADWPADPTIDERDAPAPMPSAANQLHGAMVAQGLGRETEKPPRLWIVTTT